LNPDEQPGMAHRPIAELDVPAGRLLLGQKKGRVLPVASAKFTQQLIATLH